MRIIETKVYKYTELSDAAKDKARNCLMTDSEQKLVDALTVLRNDAMSRGRVPPNPHSYGGLVGLCDGRYVYTAPVTSRNPTGLTATMTLPAGCTLAGLYHTHPNGPSATSFSRPDKREQAAYNVPSYMSVYGNPAVFSIGE